MAEQVNVRINVEGSGEGTKSLRAMKQELRDIQIEMDKAAKAGDDRLAKTLQKRFAELRNDMKDTSVAMRYLDPGEILGGWVKFAQGVTGSFAAVTGAMSLFGSESEEIQKIEKKSMAIIQTMMGLEQARQILIDKGGREQIKVLFKTTVEKYKEVAATVAQTTAQRASTASTIAGAAGFRLLGLAMKAVPILAIIGGLVALYYAMKDFGKETKSTKESVEAYNDSITALGKTIIDQSTFVANWGKEVENLRTEIDLVTGAIDSETAAIQKNETARKNAIDTAQLAYKQAQLDFNQKNRILLQQLTDSEITADMYKLKVNINKADLEAAKQRERDEISKANSIANLEKQLIKEKALTDARKKAAEEFKKTLDEFDKFRAANRQYLIDYVYDVNKATEEQIADARKNYEEQLANLRKTKKSEKEMDEQSAKYKLEFDRRVNEINLNAYQSMLSSKIALLRKNADAEISTINLVENYRVNQYRAAIEFMSAKVTELDSKIKAGAELTKDELEELSTLTFKIGKDTVAASAVMERASNARIQAEIDYRNAVISANNQKIVENETWVKLNGTLDGNAEALAAVNAETENLKKQNNELTVGIVDLESKFADFAQTLLDMRDNWDQNALEMERNIAILKRLASFEFKDSDEFTKKIEERGAAIMKAIDDEVKKIRQSEESIYLSRSQRLLLEKRAVEEQLRMQRELLEEKLKEYGLFEKISDAQVKTNDEMLKLLGSYKDSNELTEDQLKTLIEIMYVLGLMEKKVGEVALEYGKFGKAAKAVDDYFNNYGSQLDEMLSKTQDTFAAISEIQRIELEKQDRAFHDFFDKRYEELDKNVRRAAEAYGTDSENYDILSDEKMKMDEQKAKHDEEMLKEEKRIQREYVRNQITIGLLQATADYAKGLAGVWAVETGTKGVFGLATAPIVTAILTANYVANVALMRKQFQEAGKMAKGGAIEGPSHSQGGVLRELEGGEFVVNKRTMSMPGMRSLVSSLNDVGNGTRTVAPIAATVDPAVIAEIVSQITSIPVVVTESDITKTQKKVAVIQSKTTF